jgi:hypothetical protein
MRLYFLERFIGTYGVYIYIYIVDLVSSPITGLDRSCGFQEVEAPRFKTIGT